MTKEQALKLLNKVPTGEYNGDLLEMFETIAKPNEVNEFGQLNAKGYERYNKFFWAITEIKYGIEYATNGRVSYTGTNDLNTYFVR